MQFVVKRDILLKSLNFVQGVVEKKNTLPILSFSSTFYFHKILTLLEFNMVVVVTGTLTLVACLTYYNILKIIPQ